MLILPCICRPDHLQPVCNRSALVNVWSARQRRRKCARGRCQYCQPTWELVLQSVAFMLSSAMAADPVSGQRYRLVASRAMLLRSADVDAPRSQLLCPLTRMMMGICELQMSDVAACSGGDVTGFDELEACTSGTVFQNNTSLEIDVFVPDPTLASRRCRDAARRKAGKQPAKFTPHHALFQPSISVELAGLTCLHEALR